MSASYRQIKGKNVTVASEGNVGSKSDDGFVVDPPRRRAQRVGLAPADIEDVLKVGLDLPPRRDLRLVRDFDEGLARLHGRERAEQVEVAVETGGAARDMRIADDDAGRVVVAAFERLMHRHA